MLTPRATARCNGTGQMSADRQNWDSARSCQATRAKRPGFIRLHSEPPALSIATLTDPIGRRQFAIGVPGKHALSRLVTADIQT